MPSTKQIEANRANAQFSTGPRTEEGKARVAQNRITHGLAGRSALLPGEDQHAYDLMLANLHINHFPVNETEKALVKTIADAQWRLRRVTLWESELIEEALDGDPAQPSRLMRLFSRSGDPSEALAKLNRYEASLRRAWHNALKELRLQKTARHRRATVEASTLLADQRPMRGLVNDICRELNLPSPFTSPARDSKPVPTPPGPEPASAPLPQPLFTPPGATLTPAPGPSI